MKYIFITFFMLSSIFSKAQDVYKTPSGLKYHLATCRMVENVSKKMLGSDDISKYNLTPCKICKGKYGKKYHCSRSCRGPIICSTAIYKVGLEDAKSIGRSLCRRVD